MQQAESVQTVLDTSYQTSFTTYILALTPAS